MVWISFLFKFLFLTNVLIQPSTCMLSTYLQNFELVDVSSLRHEFPSIIGKIKIIVNQLHCPKGWTHFGGSCYYLSKITSIPTVANHTCNLLHSNHSNLMQIRNTIELFYAAHVLTKNNLSALVVDIDPNLLKEKSNAKILIDDQGRWQSVKDNFRAERVKYHKLKEKFLDELNSAGLRISTRLEKIKQAVTKTNYIFSNNTRAVDQYKYDNLDTKDESDELERVENMQGICDQIEWNVINNHSTVYVLTTLVISNRMICLLSNVEPDMKYKHVCEHVLDYCFANIDCGKHGLCVNTVSGFNCSCSFLYDGLRCEKISNQAKQIIGSLIIILLLSALPTFINLGRNYRRKCQREKRNKIKDGRSQQQHIMNQRRPTIDIEKSKNHGPVKYPKKRDLFRLFWVGGLSIVFLSLLLSVTMIIHFTSFTYDINDHTKLDSLINDTVTLVTTCGTISYYRMENLVFFPTALALIFIFSWSIKRERRCLRLCNGRPGILPPIEPFGTENRFTIAAVFGIIAFGILKIFEELVFGTRDPLNRGVLIELLGKIVNALLIGFRYYPVLASLQLRNITARFFVCLYILADILFTLIREGMCMGFFSLSRYYSPLEEAKLRIKLRAWFFIYGLIKNIPYFILLSYIAAELCVRFAYDTIYVSIKKKRSIWSVSVVQSDEYVFSKYYVTKLFRQNVDSNRRIYLTDVNIDNIEDFEYETELQERANQSCVKKFLNSIYHWDDDFRFTTKATSTYTVAAVFLHYLACTLVFLYISIGTDFISSLKNYIETTFNIEFEEYFSLRLIIIISGVITLVVFAFQLYLGIKNYKTHKSQLLKGIYSDIPPPANFKSNEIVLESVHYSGYLVGYMAWGFIICFNLILLILVGIQITFSKKRYTETALEITVPLLVIYLLKLTIFSTIGQYLSIQHFKGKLQVRHRRLYTIFVYFDFFADCFLSVASCIIRLIKAIALNIVYMARIDCSLHGRLLENLDSGFVAYVSYLHMEVAHTNPVMLAFCYSLYDDIIQRRPKHCYDDDDDNEDGVVSKQSTVDKKKQVLEAKKNKKEQLKAKAKQDSDEDGEIRNTSDTGNMIMSSKQSILGNQTKTQSSSGSIQSSSNHSIEQQSKHSSQQTLKEEQHTEEITVKIEQQDDDDGEEEQQEEEQSQNKSLRAEQIAKSNVSATNSTISHLVKLEEASGLGKIIKRKRARFRWFLTYTILRNYHLFDLRKDIQSRLARLHFQRSNLIDEQQHAAEVATDSQQTIADAEISGSSEIRQRIIEITTPTSEFSSTLRTQMSHAQYMQAWHENQFKRIQRKRPHSNQYGAL